jgi:hypothetical protein
MRRSVVWQTASAGEACSSTEMMSEVSSSETSVLIYQIVRRRIPESSNFLFLLRFFWHYYSDDYFLCFDLTHSKPEAQGTSEKPLDTPGLRF